MTRDISWGIPVPLDDPDAANKVLYVWFDAPLGYVSNTKQLCEQIDGDPERYTDWWKSSDARIVHFLGEDNTIFHSVIWIAMLSAEGTFSLPNAVVVNHFLNIQFPDREVEKISKSRGTAVWVLDYVEQGGDPDALRYYLTIAAPESARTVYQPAELARRYNTDLADVFGNLVSRVLQFDSRFFEAKVPCILEEHVTESDHKFADFMRQTHAQVTSHLEAYSFRSALETLMEFARGCNRYFDDKAPWVARKSDPNGAKVTIAYSLNAIKFLATSLSPFLPATSQKVLSMLNIAPDTIAWSDALLPLLQNAPVNPPTVLFPKETHYA